MKDVQEEIKLVSGDKVYSAAFDHTDTSKVFLDEKLYDFKILKEYNDNVKVISVNNKVFTVKINQEDRDNIEILTTGFGYNYEIKTATSSLLEKFVRESGKGKNKVNGIVAPMPGMVVKVNCAVGDQILENDKLVIVEAMKMENALASPLSGIVKKINAVEGIAVEKGTVLIEIE
ncbi:MAG: acetyl-CoA carboxylase biotin carboxyl carrier protein subunit [Ignavibacteriae bacterium HGW-Ignavibacteriae-4]|jgi:biotin carboxyl carrier protein|nr:MAG: acetyl-CoA carboxylase biotin carboxyl carrier protein subunit [Ignavibacteriae bacterium HGW-Ignavibacteriae-4]